MTSLTPKRLLMVRVILGRIERSSPQAVQPTRRKERGIGRYGIRREI